MAKLSLREAAEQAGTSKSTIFRAIKAGKLSAERTEDNGFAIDPAELFRVYPPKRTTVAAEHATHRSEGQDATPDEMAEQAARMTLLEAELRAMKEMLAEVRQSRDDWKEQAARMTLALPAPERRPWWKRLAG
jgi:excisionase family DNA binding protein